MTRRPALASPVATCFAIDGYGILPALLSPTEVASVQQAVDRRLAAPQGTSCERPNNTLVALRWDDPIVGNIAGDDVRMERLGTTVAADDLGWVSGYLSIKDPHSPPLWWHEDWWSWNHPVTYLRAPVQAALLCYLTDTDAGTGALRVVSGSHARSTALHAILPEAHSDESTGLDPAHAAMRDHDGQVTLELRAGDAVVIDYRLLHATHPNRGPRRRDCVLLSFAPSWGGLPADIKGHLISHPALPSAAEIPPTFGWTARLLPDYDGPRRDLEVNRHAPAEFVTTGA